MLADMHFVDHRHFQRGRRRGYAGVTGPVTGVHLEWPAGRMSTGTNGPAVAWIAEFNGAL